MSPSSSSSSADIAIVGMACRFAGDAKSPEAFHEMLVRGKDAWSEVPASRYNAAAFQHPSRDRSGSTVCRGGYFLEQNLAKWDAPFFSCSAAEAKGFDPQQRLLLEVSYECLENAGIPVEAVASTEAACFVGGFTNDYKKIVSRDIHAAPQYAMTGCSSSMLSNRVSWFYNLRGPSVTTDTACSSSMTALHLACEAIRSSSNETRTALVGGTSLILDPDDPCALNALGFLSPDSRCFSFDSRANGYARGEGICMIFLKHIDDAIRDGDPIRAVIRGTGLNSDGRTAGIVLPNGDAQERLIRSTYARAGLNPHDTQYVELHGTGTKVGDPAEVGAVSKTIAAGPGHPPLYCGSVKTRIGHTEGAAGVAAVIKCVLAMEAGTIPPNLNFAKANPRLRLGSSSNIAIPTEPVAWPECQVRRCSINNFGFGGTNAHVILDDGQGYLRSQGKIPNKSLPSIKDKKVDRQPPADEDQPARLFVLSAPEQDAIARQRKAHVDHIQAHPDVSTKLSDLAYTLSKRRSIFQWRHAVVAKSPDDLSTNWTDNTLKPAKAGTTPNIAFVFTGQGAQWHAMGRELVCFDVFARSLRESAAYLKAALGCPWDAWEELMATETESKVNRAEYSQPLCLILQIALVDLLKHWGVKPSAVVGHSSGEIGAAYASEALSRDDCLKVAYYRGLASNKAKERNPNGSMMAVGLSAGDVRPRLSAVGDAIVVACVNSPSGVTLAGDRNALEQLQSELKQDSIFCRLLQVENAYHSPQMLTVSDEYRESIRDIYPVDNASSIPFYSTVYGKQIATSRLDAQYWVENMCSTVEFVSALDDMMFADVEKRQLRSKSTAPSMLVEIGPHGAMGGPIKQFIVSRGGLEHLSYHSVLSRGKDASETAVGEAGSLWMKGAPVKIQQVNNTVDTKPSVLTDLPTYPWNHSTSYWHETRQSRNHRFPAFARHDLIGSLLDSYNPLEPVWKNHLRVSELPWLRDHQIHGDVVFPAAGMICAVIEGMRQMAETEGSDADVSGFKLREISISQALVIPNDDVGAETYLHLKRRKVGMMGGSSTAGPWLEFSFYSAQEGDVFVEHASGLVQIHRIKPVTEVDGGRELEEEIAAYRRKWSDKSAMCDRKVTSTSHYQFCEDQGLVFGKTFQGLAKIRRNNHHTVAFETRIPDSRAGMPSFCESDYLIHPATLDSVLQTMMVAIPRMDGVQKQVWVPTGAESLRISRDMPRAYSTMLHGICESERTGAREMMGSFMVGDGRFEGAVPGLVIDNFRFTGLGGSNSVQSSSAESDSCCSKLYATTEWKPDLSLVSEPDMRMLAGSNLDSHDMAQFCSTAYGIVNEMCAVALSSLDDDLDRNTLPPHLQQYISWMEMRCSAAKSGISTPPISPTKAGFEEMLEKEDGNCGINNLIDFINRYPVDGGLLRHTFRSLPAILRQETVPIAALMADDNFSRFYKEAYGLKQVNVPLVQKWFDLRAHKKPSLRVLEVGAGTASTTLPVLQQLGDEGGKTTPRFSKWTFTDISAGWFENARNILGDWKSRVEYKVLDIENDPIEQGFEAESYDVVLAVNVLHATKNLSQTLDNCRRLLKPGGSLVLGEYTNRDDLAHFIFGVLPGWWAAEDGRKHGPLLSESEWNQTLKDAGFPAGAEISLADNDDDKAHRMSTIVSTKPARREQGHISSKEIVVVVPDRCTSFMGSLAASIFDVFKAKGAANVTIMRISEAAASAGVGDGGRSVVSLLDFETPFLQNMDSTQFEQAKTLLLHSKELLWVTRSDAADAPAHPTRRIVSGLLRCLKTEDSTRRVFELHFCRDLAGSVELVSGMICRRLSSIWDDAEAASGISMDVPQEMETAEREDGVFCIPRYVPDEAMNDSLARSVDTADPAPQMDRLVQASRPLKMTIGQPGMLDTLHFVDDEDPALPLGEEEVEIEVQACALNFLDIMIAMGQIQRPVFGHEAAGIVRRVGSKVDRISPRDRVVYIGQGAMRTVIRSHQVAVHVLPASVPIEEGVSIPIAYTTAYQSLVNVARMQKGESVLIHAAAGGLGQALIQIAKMMGAEIFCTVGTSAKKQAVVSLGVHPDHIFSSRDLSFAKGIKRVTAGRGVDVVVNSLAGEALRQSWACLAPYGRFIEVGKRDILGNSGLDMQPFVNNVSFSGVNLEHMLVHEPERCSELVGRVLELFSQGAVGFIRPIAVRDFSETEAAFREMQRGTHIGKLVLRVTPESRVPVVPRRHIPLRLNPDATYLLVGGLGGLGRAQALFMAEHGARNLAFISRSGAAKKDAKDLLSKLAESGVQAKAYAGDVSDNSQLKDILANMSENMPPIRGVIQGAMVLADSLFHKMSHDQWVTATRPKIQGSWNLHELLPEDLDFFVVLSSLAGIIGSVSQGNYAAGNTFQDALVHYRRSKGLAAQSLDLGVMRGFGYVEENQDVGARMNTFKLASVGEQQFFHLLRSALAGAPDGESPLPSQLLVGSGSGGVQQASQRETPGADFYWLRTLPQFAYLQQLDVRDDGDGTHNDSDDNAESKLIGRLGACKSMSEAHDAAQDVLLCKIASIISVPVEDINTASPVYTYGVDSLVAVELRNWLAMEVKSDLSIFDLTSNAPISEVSRKIASRSQLVPTEVKVQDAAA